MDLLVSLSTSVAYFASIAMLILDFRNDPSRPSIGTFFDSSVFLIMFILMGRTLEAYAKSRTTDAVSALGSLRPDTALLVETESQIAPSSSNVEKNESRSSEESNPGSTEGRSFTRSVPVDHLELGDHIVIAPGALPPTDGIIVSGSTTFDESSLTGESKPVTKQPGDEIFTGTVNITSAITVQVTRLASDTMLERIISAVSDANSRKAPIEKLAEKLTGVFVPIIVYISLGVLAVWLSIALTGRLSPDIYAAGGGKVFFAIEFAIATLVVACPCGIGLAVPCANAVGNGLDAKAGILASGGGEAFLAATKVTMIAFDKTGTLTVGKSVVTDEDYSKVSQADVSPDVLRKAVREIEAQSTHPLAAGLVEHLTPLVKDSGSNESIEITDSSEIRGRGLEASIKTRDSSFYLLVGNQALMAENRVSLSEVQTDLIEKWSNEAKSVILVSLRTSLCNSYHLGAMYALSDPPREEAKTILTLLREKGIKLAMVSGDNEKTAKAVGKMVGIDEALVKAGVGPEGKADVIREFQALPISDSGSFGLLRRVLALGQQEKEVVMFVGGASRLLSLRRPLLTPTDGINDSVALAAATPSVAMGHGSQATLASADFVLLSTFHPLSTLPTLLHLSRRIINRQKLNLSWALVFNLFGLPLAAGAFWAIGGRGVRLTPVWGSVAMAGSSLSVVMSSLAMRWGL